MTSTTLVLLLAAFVALLIGGYTLYLSNSRASIKSAVDDFLMHGVRAVPVEELAMGKNDDSRLLLSIVNHVFDVTVGKKFYGLNGPYAGFTGRDATRAFATGDFSTEGLLEDTSGLTKEECSSILGWLGFYKKNQGKYPFVGYMQDGMFIHARRSGTADSVVYERSPLFHELIECSVGGKIKQQQHPSESSESVGNCRSRYDFKSKTHSRWCKLPATVPRRLRIGSSLESRGFTEKCVCVHLSRADDMYYSVYDSECDPAASHCEYVGELHIDEGEL
jgi:hypothetical protein